MSTEQPINRFSVTTGDETTQTTDLSCIEAAPLGSVFDVTVLAKPLPTPWTDTEGTPSEDPSPETLVRCYEITMPPSTGPILVDIGLGEIEYCEDEGSHYRVEVTEMTMAKLSALPDDFGGF